MDGWILLHKKICDNPLWQEKPFARGQAWVDLLLMTNYSEGDLLTRGHIVHIERGQCFRTLGYLANRWGWSKKKVRCFLKLLENQKMGHAEGHADGILITIENYEFYQTLGHESGTAEGTSQGTQGYTKQLRIKKNKEKGFASQEIKPGGAAYKPFEKEEWELDPDYGIDTPEYFKKKLKEHKEE